VEVVRNEREHFRTVGQKLDKFPQRATMGSMLHPSEQRRPGSILRVRLSGRAHRAGSNQGRRWRADFFLLRAVRAAWLNSLRKKS
jgi:hypothetical protein